MMHLLHKVNPFVLFHEVEHLWDADSLNIYFRALDVKLFREY